jgi:hypothetical protein
MTSVSSFLVPNVPNVPNVPDVPYVRTYCFVAAGDSGAMIGSGT